MSRAMRSSAIFQLREKDNALHEQQNRDHAAVGWYLGMMNRNKLMRACENRLLKFILPQKLFQKLCK